MKNHGAGFMRLIKLNNQKKRMIVYPKVCRKKFPFYIRECKHCHEWFESEIKRGEVCEKCREESNKTRIKNSLKTRGILKEDEPRKLN